MDDNLWRLVTAFDISHDAMRNIRQNFLITAGMNAVALVLSIPSGFLSPALTALICNGSTIVASLNAVRPLL